MIAAHTVVVPANHGFGAVDVPINLQALTKRGISIGDDVWIGSGCRVLEGVRIGDGAVIRAGSVVTKDVDAYGVAYGVPAVVARSRWPTVDTTDRKRSACTSRAGADAATSFSSGASPRGGA